MLLYVLNYITRLNIKKFDLEEKKIKMFYNIKWREQTHGTNKLVGMTIGYDMKTVKIVVFHKALRKEE